MNDACVIAACSLLLSLFGNFGGFPRGGNPGKGKRKDGKFWGEENSAGRRKDDLEDRDKGW